MSNDQENSVIYCVPIQRGNHTEQIKNHCFGDCGKISLAGAMDLGDEIGACWVCHTTECPYEKGHVGPIGNSEIDNLPIYVRALEEKSHDE